MKKPKVLVGVVLGLVAVVGLYFLNRYWIAPATQRTATPAGARPMAPNFTLPDLDGRNVELAELKGKVVLLNFWATWCGPCRVEIPWFVEFQEKFGGQGFTVLGVLVQDSPESARRFAGDFKMNYPVAVGDSRVAETYGVFGLPTTVMIGRDGRIYSKHTGLTAREIFEQEIKELLAAEAGEEADFHLPQGARAEAIELGDPAEIDSEVPGVNLTKLTSVQVTAFKEHLEGQPCPCGCEMNLLECRNKDRSCGVSRKLAREQLDKFLKGPV